MRLRRYAAAGILAAAAVAVAVGSFELGLLPQVGALAGALVLSNLVYARMKPERAELERHLLIQIIVDLCLLSALLFVSGGLANPLFPGLVFPVMLAVALVTQRAARAVTAFASVLFLVLAAIGAAGWVPTAPELSVGALAARAGVGIAMLWVTNGVGHSICALSREREREAARASGELHLLNSELSMVADAVGDALFLWKDDQNVVWSNRRACADFGCGAEKQAPGCGAICPHRAVVLKAIATGAAAEQEKVVEKDGESRTLRARGVPLRGPSGAIDRVLLVVHDLTGERTMEAQLLQATKMGVLARATGAIAHELGNPLASLSTRVALLQQNQTAEFVQESAAVLNTQIARIQRLVRSVQRFGRSIEGDRGDCDLATVISDVLRKVQLDPRMRRVVLDIVVGDGLPPVSVGRDQLTQVVLNLVINAAEAMPDGGTLKIGAGSGEGFVRLRIEDDGIGIPMQMRQNLFRPIESSKENGSGLGLFLSRWIVTEAGGDIRVLDASPKGTIFELDLRTQGTWAAAS